MILNSYLNTNFVEVRAGAETETSLLQRYTNRHRFPIISEIQIYCIFEGLLYFVGNTRVDQ
uniref:Uncharacterized protein n=1 Tax=Romanomermis culicivorax TaxID=13658 RepID=A0A915L0S5_ROMCU